MASFSKNLNQDSRYSITLNVNDTNSNINDNTSVVVWSLTATKTSGTGYYDYGANNPVYVEIDGSVEFNQNIPYDFQYQTPKTITLASGSKTIKHNDDGRKTIFVKASFSDYTCFGGATVEGNVTLTEIKRASIPSTNIASNEKVILGEKEILIKTNRKSTTFKHKLEYTINGTTGLIANNVTSQYSWTPEASLANLITESEEATCTIRCTTYNGSTSIGVKTVNIKLMVPTSIKPIIDVENTTVIDIGTEMQDKLSWGLYVQNKSQLKITVAALTSGGSPIDKYEVTGIDVESISSNIIVSTILSKAEESIIKIKVTDKRGRSDELEIPFICYEYSKPQITKVEAVRCLADGTINEDGTYLKYTFIGSVSPVNDKNHNYNFKIGYKEINSYEYDYVTLNKENFGIDNENIILNSIIFDNTKRYELRFIIEDSFYNRDIKNEVSIIKILDTAPDLINFNASGKSMAFGMVSQAKEEEKRLDIALDTNFTKSIKIDNQDIYVFEII